VVFDGMTPAESRAIGQWVTRVAARLAP
jgi:hypothetical protein